MGPCDRVHRKLAILLLYIYLFIYTTPPLTLYLCTTPTYKENYIYLCRMDDGNFVLSQIAHDGLTGQYQKTFCKSCLVSTSVLLVEWILNNLRLRTSNAGSFPPVVLPSRWPPRKIGNRTTTPNPTRSFIEFFFVCVSDLSLVHD